MRLRHRHLLYKAILGFSFRVYKPHSTSLSEWLDECAKNLRMDYFMYCCFQLVFEERVYSCNCCAAHPYFLCSLLSAYSGTANKLRRIRFEKRIRQLCFCCSSSMPVNPHIFQQKLLDGPTGRRLGDERASYFAEGHADRTCSE